LSAKAQREARSLVKDHLQRTKDRSIRCPSCKSCGDWTETRWNCRLCGRSFPIHGSIVDFRVLPARDDLSFAHFESERNERDRINRALALAASADFSGLVNNYFAEFPTSSKIEHSEQATLLNADEYAREWLYQIEQVIPLGALAARPESVLLEVGCGTAGISCALADQFETVIALDADLDRLVLAQKHCQDSEVRNVLLLCAFGEAIPLASDAIDMVTCIEVLEHAAEQCQLLSELRRILAPGGWLYLTTPNRFTLGREPHVQLWGVGWLPRSLMDTYVRFRSGLPYTGKRNLSYWELKSMLGKIFGEHVAFCREQRVHYTRQARIANRLLSVPGMRFILPPILAGFHVKAEKNSSSVMRSES